MRQLIREGYIREGPDYHDDPMLMKIAQACAGCVRQYPDDMDCFTCKYDPARYTEPRRTMMMRTAYTIQADMSAANAYYASRDRSDNITAAFYTVFSRRSWE
jgi:hypothetical protein